MRGQPWLAHGQSAFAIPLAVRCNCSSMLRIYKHYSMDLQVLALEGRPPGRMSFSSYPGELSPTLQALPVPRIAERRMSHAPPVRTCGAHLPICRLSSA
jgi:hypothetical protein